MENAEIAMVAYYIMDSDIGLRQQKQLQEAEDLINATFSNCSDSSSDSVGSDLEPEIHPKCNDFLKIIDAYGDDDFKSHMRLQRSTAYYLIHRYSQYETLKEVVSKIGSKKTVYMYVWYISNSVTYRQLGNLFGITKSSAWNAVRRVTAWLVSISHEFIKWPQGSIAEENQRKFAAKKKIPGIIGAIDCTHISIKAPTVGKEGYFDRKQNYSLVLQAVVDADKKFTSISCGEPGSLHDYRVLRRSELYQEIETNYEAFFSNSTFILGDSAYPATSWLVPPFKDNGHLTDTQRDFNKIHSSTRIVVENTFGLLKTRFRRLLKFTEQTSLSALTNLIVSACVLHNICIIKDDMCNFNIPEVPADDIIFDDFTLHTSERSINRRNELFNYLQDQNII